MSESYTPEQLAEIEARERNATPGPWYAHSVKDNHGYTWVGFNRTNDERRWDVLLANLNRHKDWDAGFRDRALPDAEFIAHARADIPLLLSIVREREAELARVTAEIARLVEAFVDTARDAHSANPDHKRHFYDCADPDCVARRTLLAEIEEAARKGKK